MKMLNIFFYASCNLQIIVKYAIIVCLYTFYDSVTSLWRRFKCASAHAVNIPRFVRSELTRVNRTNVTRNMWDRATVILALVLVLVLVLCASQPHRPARGARGVRHTVCSEYLTWNRMWVSASKHDHSSRLPFHSLYSVSFVRNVSSRSPAISVSRSVNAETTSDRRVSRLGRFLFIINAFQM